MSEVAEKTESDVGGKLLAQANNLVPTGFLPLLRDWHELGSESRISAVLGRWPTDKSQKRVCGRTKLCWSVLFCRGGRLAGPE